jgi:hypothetical protein
MTLKLRHQRRIYLLLLGMLSACATHEQQSRQPAAPVAASVTQEWSFAEEWTRAAAESAPGSAGLAWEQSVNPTVEQAYGAVLDDCAMQRNSGDPATNSGQRLVLDVAASGSVRQVWSEFDSPLLTCARAVLSGARFEPPPMDGYRLGLVLHLGEPEMASEFPRLPRPMPGSISSGEALRLAITDMGSQEGRRYMERFSATFLAYLSPSLTKCMSIPLVEFKQSLRGLQLILEIAADGTAQRVLVEPDPETAAPEPLRSPRTDCLRDSLSRAKLAMPPWDGFWLYVVLDNPPPEVSTE